MDDQLEKAIFSIISNAGEARSMVFQAIQTAKDGFIDEARELMNGSRELTLAAHKQQMELLVMEAQGNPVGSSVLLIHAEDILMATVTERDLGQFIIDLFEKINEHKHV